MNELSVESRILAHQLRVFGMFQQMELQELLGSYTNDSNYEATRERMTYAWHEYQKAMPRLSCPFRTPLSFFRSPTWEDSKLWSWTDLPRTEPGRNREPVQVEPLEAEELVRVNTWRAQRGLEPLEA